MGCKGADIYREVGLTWERCSNPCIVLGGINIDRRLRVRGVECVLTLTQIVSMNTY